MEWTTPPQASWFKDDPVHSSSSTASQHPSKLLISNMMGASTIQSKGDTIERSDSPWMFASPKNCRPMKQSPLTTMQDSAPTQAQHNREGLLVPNGHDEPRSTAAQNQSSDVVADTAAPSASFSSDSSIGGTALRGRSNKPKFHFCPADVLILGLGVSILALQAHVALQFKDSVKSIMLMVCMGFVILSALTHNLITCRVIRMVGTSIAPCTSKLPLTSLFSAPHSCVSVSEQCVSR